MGVGEGEGEGGFLGGRFRALGVWGFGWMFWWEGRKVGGDDVW